MLPIVYGSFLKRSEVSRGKYELAKPKLSVYVNCFLAFSLASLLTVGGAYAFETIVHAPTRGYEESTFTQYQAVNNRLMRMNNELRQLKPTSAVNELGSFIETKNKHRNVTIQKIDYRAGMFNVIGQVDDLKAGDAFAAELNTANKKTVSFNKVTRQADYIEFSMTVADKAAAPVKKAPAKGGNQ